MSNDPVARNAMFAEKEGFPFLLLSDEDGKIGRAYGAMEDPDAKSENRISYVIGPDGVIVEAYPKVKTATHAEELLAVLRR
jgi:thioredoxin-dependent peroxiredoxin